MMQVLAEQRVEIEGRSIPVIQSNRFRNTKTAPAPIKVNQLLLQPSDDQASPRNILNILNEDCIRKILERLILPDLCSVAKTCRKLNGIAKIVFDHKHKNRTIDLNNCLMHNSDDAMTRCWF